jgi:hypothetical protein
MEAIAHEPDRLRGTMCDEQRERAWQKHKTKHSAQGKWPIRALPILRRARSNPAS